MRLLIQNSNIFPCLAAFLLIGWIGNPAYSQGTDASTTALVDFNTLDLESIRTLNSEAELVTVDGKRMLEATHGFQNQWPHVAILGKWDLSDFNRVEADITNLSDRSLRVGCRVDNPGASGKKNQSSGGVTVDPGETRTVVVHFNRSSPHNFEERLPGMQGYPDGTRFGPKLDPSNVVAIQFFGHRPSSSQRFRVSNIRAAGEFDPEQFNAPLPDPFMPFIDELGQYKHRDWPGKTHGPEDMRRQRELEERDLAAHPGPGGWNRWGGWLEGPQLEATGHFRVEQVDGRWWFVDPDGYLFWSYGPDCVRMGGDTFVEGGDRPQWFENLPDPGSNDPLAAFYDTKKQARGDYAGEELKTYSFGAANLYRKYGEDWENYSAELAHRRLRSWGMNTMGLWSIGKPVDPPRTPYVDWVFYWHRNIRAWGITRKPFPDFFHEDFEADLLQRAQGSKGHLNEDPYCIGIFIDNELTWGGDTEVGRNALRSPADQPARIVLMNMLKEKYETIDKLNQAWGSQFADWAEMEKPIQNVPPGAREDLDAYLRLTAETYFSTVRRVMDEVFPNKLYLGPRFADYNPIVVEVADKYVDVLSFNIYRHTVAHWQPPVPISKPMVIGEFHFGALDRGTFSPGLVQVENQTERGLALERYLTGALKNPLIVGAHWFQYRDQVTSGRPLDMENHQIGFVDICDVPYAETVAGSRRAGYSLYETRTKGRTLSAKPQTE
ncbi:MAG: beta-galactosidase [Kiritimatiellia bacterium]